MNLKNTEKIVTSKFVGTGPSFYKEKNLPGRGLTKVEKHWRRGIAICWNLFPDTYQNLNQVLIIDPAFTKRRVANG